MCVQFMLFLFSDCASFLYFKKYILFIVIMKYAILNNIRFQSILKVDSSKKAEW